jgi:hypothetical protein
MRRHIGPCGNRWLTFANRRSSREFRYCHNQFSFEQVLGESSTQLPPFEGKTK